MSEYSFQPIHVKGINNLLADYFSRLDEDPPNKDLISNPELIEDESILPVESNLNAIQSIDQTQVINHNAVDLDIPLDTFREEQAKDPSLSKILEFLKSGDNHKPNVFKFYYIHPDMDVLCWDKHSAISFSKNPVIVVSDSLKGRILSIIHVSHLDIIKTHDLLLSRFYWRGMFADTANFVASCDVCMKNKKRNIPKAPLQTNPIPKHASEIISLDILGPLRNNGYVLTIVDHFTRYLELFPLNTISAEAVAEALLFYITRNGRPAVVLSDSGTQFVSEVFEKVPKAIGIKPNRTTVAHPAANAISERVNTSIKSPINSLLSQNVKFRHAVIIHQKIYNGCSHPATKFTPNLLHFGRELPMLFDTFDFSISSEQQDKSTYLHDLLETLKKIYNSVYKNLKGSQFAQNLRYMQKAKLREFKVGDTVYIKSRETYNNKLTGPFEILRRNSTVTYTLRILNNEFANPFKLHVDRLVLAPPRRQYLMPQPTTSLSDSTNMQNGERNNSSDNKTHDVEQPSQQGFCPQYFPRSRN